MKLHRYNQEIDLKNPFKLKEIGNKTNFPTFKRMHKYITDIQQSNYISSDDIQYLRGLIMKLETEYIKRETEFFERK
jgi:hypothetical protein